MAKNESAAGPPGKLAGKAVAFVGKFGQAVFGPAREFMASLVEQEGGTVVDGLKDVPDYVVEGKGVGGKPPSAIAKIQKKHPGVAVIDDAGFYELVHPTPGELRELIKSGPQGNEFWQNLQYRLRQSGARIDLSGSDFRGATIEGNFENLHLDDCDFRGATISASLDTISGAKFDDATFNKTTLKQANDCSFTSAMMVEATWNANVFDRCNFTGAKLSIRHGGYVRASQCVFQQADLTDATISDSHFVAADFRGAKLIRACLERCDFTNADFSGAELTGADLRNAKLVSANLSNANLTNAVLCSANLTGAIIDGADFTGAYMTDAHLNGLDSSKAKNLVVKAARAPGPNLRELAKVAVASSDFLATIEFQLTSTEYVLLRPHAHQYFSGGGFIHGEYLHYKANSSAGNYVPAPTFEEGMLNLADYWSRGTPKFETVKVIAANCSLGGEELRELAVAAWYEACGLSPPTADEFAAVERHAATEQANQREAMIAELHGGPAGIAKWNGRSDQQRRQLGKLRKHDFANAHLAGAKLKNQDFEGSSFGSADLSGANLYDAKLKGARFANANLHEAVLNKAKCPDADFSNATLTNSILHLANFRRCSFQGANLSGAELHYSEIQGADLSTAILNNVAFHETKFDEKTRFPPGFLPPDGLLWKGTGPRPGSAPPPPPPESGSLDFDAFLAQLESKVEAARMQKAGSMLKAERFQLFADIGEDIIAGVVKSQTSGDLVYSCRLASDGSFGCCTQNLRHCGGLRGALCKHLLVLIIGLAKAGELDAATVNHWIELSKSRKPTLDEDDMSATFLRYKGAEAGEVDWRPTETIPEDFYAM